MKKILFPVLFPLSFAQPSTTITSGNHAYLDNGIRALPRLSEAEEEKEEGAVR